MSVVNIQPNIANDRADDVLARGLLKCIAWQLNILAEHFNETNRGLIGEVLQRTGESLADLSRSLPTSK